MKAFNLAHGFIELTEQTGRVYWKSVRRNRDGKRVTIEIPKKVYKDSRGWLYIVNEDERGRKWAEKVSYKNVATL